MYAMRGLEIDLISNITGSESLSDINDYFKGYENIIKVNVWSTCNMEHHR